MTGWSGAGCSGTGTCTVTLTQAKTVTATFDTSSGSGTPIKINFQPSASTVPSGYTMDDGSGYTSSRGYGWDDNLTGLMRERNAEADQRLDTNIGLNNVNLNTWTYDLPNGDYLVELASGDATWSHGQRVVVEGTVVIDSIATSGGQYVTVTDHPVTITDGALTITIGQSTTGNYTDLNYVIITPVTIGTSLTPSEPSILLAELNGTDQPKTPSYMHRTIQQQPHTQRSTGIIRQGGGLFSLRFGLSQLPINGSNPLVHLVSHSGTPSTTITPTPGSVLPGSTVTFTWSHTGGGTGATNVPYRYTGKEQDDSTGLYFYEARYYDPVLGRFISADTIVPDPLDPQSLNRYSYAANNPILYNDPSGHCPWCAIAVFAVVGGVTAGIQSDWDAGAIFKGAWFGAVGGLTGGAGAGAAFTAGSSALGTTGGILAAAIHSGFVSFGASFIGGGALGALGNGGEGLLLGANIAGGVVSGGFRFGGASLGFSTWGTGRGALLGAGIGHIVSAVPEGAVSAAIRGKDPGTGALLGLVNSAVRIGTLSFTLPSDPITLLFSFLTDGLVEIMAPSTGRGFLSRRGAGELTSGTISASESSGNSSKIDVALAVSVDDASAFTSMVDGATMITSARFLIYGSAAFPVSADVLIARQFGLNLSPANRFAMQGVRLLFRGTAAGMVIGGSVMFGAGVHHFFFRSEDTR